MSKLDQKASKNGYSTIELIIVATVIIIVGTISIPMVQANLAYYRLDTGASLLTTELTYARMEAIKRNREVRMIFDNSNRQMTIKTTSLTGAEIILRGPTPLPNGIVFQGTPPASIDFTSLGRNKINGSTVIRLNLMGKADIRTITVSATGNIG